MNNFENIKQNLSIEQIIGLIDQEVCEPDFCTKKCALSVSGDCQLPDEQITSAECRKQMRIWLLAEVGEQLDWSK